ncbi:hypothetical protein M426DRAFT_319726 [Hypoxylon sp. CI-4A]|nr:hypothetical protein M426DRAFT_319726 [Hypoxylon sp. CI-4A]
MNSGVSKSKSAPRPVPAHRLVQVPPFHATSSDFSSDHQAVNQPIVYSGRKPRRVPLP